MSRNVLRRDLLFLFQLLVLCQDGALVQSFNVVAGCAVLHHRIAAQQHVTMIMLSSSDNDDDNINQHETDDDDDDMFFYRDLSDAKKQQFGQDLPPEQVKESAKSAASEFLNAMKEARQEFDATKKDLGADAAVAFMMDKIQIEDTRRELEAGDIGFGDEEDDDDISDAFE